MRLDRFVQCSVQTIVWGVFGLASLGYIFGGIWFLAAIWGH